MQRPGPLVLCIDDETVGLSVRKMILEHSGYIVLTAEDGATGLEVFAANSVDIVVLDYSMPGMDGGQVAAHMRQTKPQVPILLLSANMGLPENITSLADVYMTKGEGAAVLLSELKGLLAKVLA